MSSVAPPAESVAGEHLQLPIGGMTCASCAARVERRLNRLDGVRASVNYATERASVQLAPGAATTPHDVVAAVEQPGYEALLPAPAPDAPALPDSADGLRRRLVFAALATLPLCALAMVEPLRFDGWHWVSLALATPVLVWAGAPFHRAAVANLRHGTATMDTLVSLGTIAAWAWSVVALAFLGAADAGGHGGVELVPRHGAPGGDVYFEAVGVVITFLLAGAGSRRARSAAPGPRCGRCSSSAPRTWRSSTPASSAACRSSRSRSATASSCGPARRSPPTASCSRVARRSTARC